MVLLNRLCLGLVSVAVALLTSAGTWVMGPGKGSHGAVANVTFVQSGGESDGGSSSLAFSPLSPVTNGNLICLVLTWNSSTVTLSSISSNRGSNLTLLHNPTEITSSGFRSAMAYGFCTSSGSLTLTATFSGSSSIVSMMAHEYSGATASPIESSALTRVLSAGTGTDAYASGSVTVSTTNAKVMGVAQDLNLNDTLTTGTGYTGRITTQADATGRGETEDKTASPGSTTATFTSSAGFIEIVVGALVIK